MAKYVSWLSEISAADVSLVGGKGAQLGELVRANLPVPDGFIVTTVAYNEFLEITGLRTQISTLLTGLNQTDSTRLKDLSNQIKELILTASVPAAIAQEIEASYAQLCGGETETAVAVRSSATAEDLPGASFAGQQSTFLNVHGAAPVLHAVQRCWASLFESRALYYRADKGLDHLQTQMAVPVQRMIQSEKSGILFTADPVTGDLTKIVIEASFGLGEPIVSGQITPDHYIVDKASLLIENREVGKQAFKLVRRTLEAAAPVMATPPQVTPEAVAPEATNDSFVISESATEPKLTTPVPAPSVPLIPEVPAPIEVVLEESPVVGSIRTEEPVQPLAKPIVPPEVVNNATAPFVTNDPIPAAATLPTLEEIQPSTPVAAAPILSEAIPNVETPSETPISAQPAAAATPAADDTFVIKEADLQADLEAIRQAYAQAKSNKIADNATLTRTGLRSVTLTFTGESGVVTSAPVTFPQTVVSPTANETENNQRIDLSELEGNLPKLTDSEILELSRVGLTIEDHYQHPQDIEWAIAEGKIFILQSRPITSIEAPPAPVMPAIEESVQLNAATPVASVQPEPLVPAASDPVVNALNMDSTLTLPEQEAIPEVTIPTTSSEPDIPKEVKTPSSDRSPQHYLNIAFPAAAYQLPSEPSETLQGIVIQVPALIKHLYGLEGTQRIDMTSLAMAPLQTFLTDLIGAAKRLNLTTLLVLGEVTLDPQVMQALTVSGLDAVADSPPAN